MNRFLLHPSAKPLVFLLCLGPLAWLVSGAATGYLGPNPAETLIRSTGDWSLRMLWFALAVTPLRLWTGWPALARLRRLLGLTAAFYVALHFACYAWLDQDLALDVILRDIAKRPFILVGTLAGLLMLPLAATSFNAAVRWLGAARWRALHRAAYAAALLGLLHFFWMRSAKNLWGEVSVYATVLALLFGARLWRWRRASRVAPVGTP